MIITKPVDLSLLQQELAAGGVVVPALGTYNTAQRGTGPGQTILHTYDVTGEIIDLPPEAVPIVDAHVAPPRAVEYAGSTTVDAVTVTTDELPHEAFRFVTVSQHVYDASFTMTAVDRGNGTTKRTRAEMVFKRLASTLVQVGTTYVPATFADTATGTWAILPTVDGTDLVISVRGAAGRTIDWLLTGDIGAYAPGGLAG